MANSMTNIEGLATKLFEMLEAKHVRRDNIEDVHEVACTRSVFCGMAGSENRYLLTLLERNIEDQRDQVTLLWPILTAEWSRSSSIEIPQTDTTKIVSFPVLGQHALNRQF